MFNPDFYPTPESVIYQMLEGYSIENKIILEPSAGKGNIVDYLNSNGANEVIACESNLELQSILQTKCKVVQSDFLKLSSEAISHIDMIVMNPPFSKDEAHILHAWEIAPAGCQIISLCNNNTLSNPFSGKRKELLTIVSEYGKQINLGDCFKESERNTGVEIGLIQIQKPGSNYNQEFEGFFMEEDEPEDQAIGIMPYNFVRDLVNRYVEAVKLFDKQLELGAQMNSLVSGYFSSSLGFQVTQEGKQVTRNSFKKDFQKSGWNTIISKMNLTKYATKGLREDINKFVERQTEIPFTMKNIYQMIDMIIQTRGQQMDKAILEVFDRLTKHYSDNRYNLEGWKTNSHYLLNRKFIIPNMAPRDKWNTGDSIDNAYGAYFDLMEDVCKAICYITGQNWDEIGSLSDRIRYTDGLKYDGKAHFGFYSIQSAMSELKAKGKHYETIYREKPLYGQLFDWGFFEVRAYKKGTMHFTFKDEDVWALFNQRVAKLKGYPLYESTPENKKKNNPKPNNSEKRDPIIINSFKVA